MENLCNGCINQYTVDYTYEGNDNKFNQKGCMCISIIANNAIVSKCTLFDNININVNNKNIQTKKECIEAITLYKEDILTLINK